MNDLPLNHIAIATAGVAEAAKAYVALGFHVHEPEVIERERVRVQVVSRGMLRIELLEACPAGEGPVAKYIAKRGTGLHHIALTTEDVTTQLAELGKSGIRALSGYPATGHGGSIVAFLDPKTTGGVLIELVQRTENRHK